MSNFKVEVILIFDLKMFVNTHPVSEKELGRTLDKLQEENLTNHEFPARHLRLQ